MRISKKLADLGISGKVATLAPIYPLEGGLNIYPELASGPFAYRTAEFADARLRSYFKTTSPSSIGQLLLDDPPAAILVGFDSVLEAPLVKFAEDNGYDRVINLGFTDRYGTAILYVRKSLVPAN